MNQEQQRSDAPSPEQVAPEILQAPRIASPATDAGDIVATDAPRLGEAHGSFAEFHQGYVSGYIQFADTKAAWVFAIASGLLAYIFSTRAMETTLLLPAWSVPFVLASATLLLLVLAAAFSFLVIAPRFSRTGDGIVFFASVAKKKSADSFVREIASMNEGRLTEARLKHCYDISFVCARKYKYLRLAFWTGLLGLIAMAGTLLLIT
jgi:hypothetical protein